MVIGGKAVDAISGQTFESENPYTGRPWAVIPDAGPDDVDAAVAAARAALDGEWGQMTGFARARLMRGGRPDLGQRTRDPFTLG
jgi:aldehyde dehydrogenase (NAD+)